ncbi:filamentous hemagglutinin N-terminal domain-containing protein [Aerosakkonemataceae cyanobacterium BLCC-F50]|uniref:Filamentous hemagglutinin N-terminal domain-containing protein n=1 Tax=Floridaenema flaviceps BLCC-F50 TaxID=3153642 RepID=A0ABV4Y0U9_9CYAN
MKPSPSLFYIAQTSTLLTLLAAYPATAQIIPDNTVNTTVTPNGNINVIEGGTRAGTNLFHSFQEFSIPTGGEAFFNNAFDIRNIFSRVTGRSISNIDGLIRANGVANLFLLNPNGIIFGPNARLNIGGSFLATTANSFKFADGTEFSATNPQATPLLSINVPIGLQMGTNPGNITVNGTGLNRPLPVEGETLEQQAARLIAFEQDFLNNPQGLLVQPGKTIALVGGNLTFNGGLVTVRQGRIEIGSVNSGVVNLNPTETGFVLGYENISNFGEIQMSQLSAVAASGEGAGEIRVRGGKISLNEISSIGANTIGNENGKSVTVEAEQLSLFGGSFLVSGTFSSGDAGNLIVKAKDSVEVSGISADGLFRTSLQTFSNAGGKAGNLTIDTGRLTIRDGAFISTGASSKGQGGDLNIQASQEVQVNGISADGKFSSALATQTNNAGNAGNMTIETGRLIVQNGAFVSTRTSGKGEGGNLTVRASEEVKVSGISANGKSSSLLTSGSNGSGNSGDLRIETGKLIIQDGAEVSSFTSGEGKAGNLFINAREEVQVNGTSADGNFRSTLTTLTSGAGNAGDMTIETGRLIIKDGAFVSTETRGTGNGGNLLVQAKDSVEVLGTMPNGLETELSAGVGLGEGIRGLGGNLTIETGTLSIRDGGNVSTATSGQGNAGNLLVKARDLVEVVGEGLVTPELPGLSSSLDSNVSPSGVGNGGNLTIETERLSIRDGGQVSARVFGQGKGGSIQIKASEQVEVVGAGRTRNFEDGKTFRFSSSIDTDVSVNSIGSGGDINIDTQVLSLRDGGSISANTYGKGDAGNVRIQANELVEVVGTDSQNFPSRISSSVSFGVGQGGDISINTKQLSIRNGGEISTGTSGVGNSGNIYIRATEAVELLGKSADPEPFGSRLRATVLPGAKGNGGNITVETKRLTLIQGNIITFTGGEGNAGNILLQATEAVELNNKSYIFANTVPMEQATGNGGKITIETGKLLLNDQSYIVNSSFGQGRGGTLTVTASESIEINGSLLSANTYGNGDGGDIILETGQLVVSNDAMVSASTLGTGDAGNISIKTKSLIVQSEGLIIAGTLDAGKGGSLTITADVVEIMGTKSNLSVETGGTGNGGILNINARSFIVRDGAQISSGTRGTGKAGDLKVTAEIVELTGKGTDGRFSGLFASTEGAGNGGNLIINTGRLIVRDGASLSAGSFGTGAAGNIQVTAGSILINNGGVLRATSTAGSKGNINVQTSSLIMRRGSEISTNATGKATGGNIIINTDVLAALENSDISANAEDSFGGRVIINAQGIFGTKFRPDSTPESDITATSKLGPQFSGTVEINTPEVDPSSGLVNLPENAVDVSRLVPKGCVARRKETGTFYITGNDGFQYRPGDGLMSPLPTGEVRSIPENNSSERSEVNGRIIEAQGVYKLENGQMVLGWECPE